jgi:TPR repeat protein
VRRYAAQFADLKHVRMTVDAEWRAPECRPAEDGETMADTSYEVEWEVGWSRRVTLMLLLPVVIACCSQVAIAEQSPSSIESLKVSAGRGDAAAQVRLGMAYEKGDGVAKDPVEAVRWYRMAADQGDGDAQVLVSRAYHQGNGVAKDPVEAVRWIRKAALQGNEVAQDLLGLAYADGEGVGQDLVEAVRWYRKAADQGFGDAQTRIGAAYMTGEGVAKDPVEALRWYRMAAEQGDAESQLTLGVAYKRGYGVPKDLVVASSWLRKAADQGNANAQYVLGTMYEDGEGVAKDAVESVRWYRKSADQGVSEAQAMVGAAYHDGKGVAKDYAEAARWLQKAAGQGDAFAQRLLGGLYDDGKGVPKDVVEAVRWTRLAANQGDAPAQLVLAIHYHYGLGVLMDDVQALKWAILASAKGFEDPTSLLDDLTAQLSRPEILEAQRLAREFVPEAPKTVVEPAERKSSPDIPGDAPPRGTGTGFFIASQGYVVTSAHVVAAGTDYQVLTKNGTLHAALIRIDAANDLAVLKIEAASEPLPIAPSRGVKLGASVATVGFPNPGLQGFSPKLSKGEIASLAGPQDDPRYFQVSVAIQPGNSGGALIDEHGNVIGVVAARLSDEAALATSGQTPQNVNYAVKSTYVLSLTEAVRGLAEKLPAPRTVNLRFEDAVAAAERATVLVIVR